VSRYGLVAHASSLDQIGPIASNAADVAVILTTICGYDAADSTSANLPAEDFSRELEVPLSTFRIGVPRQARSNANSSGVAAALDQAIETLRRLGGQIIDIDLPHVDHGIAAYYLISTAEASSNLARFDGIRYGRRAVLKPGEGLEELYRRSRAEGFGPEVQRRIMLGAHVLSAGYYDAYYLTALKARRLIKQDYDRAFGATGPACDAVLMPTSPTSAFRLGEKVSDPLAMYLEDVYTVGVNLAGLPAVAFRGGFESVVGREDASVPEGCLPVGLQLIGPPLAEARLLRLVRMFEKTTTWHERRPAYATA
jgi:aspartyl-tRNA(Asn)/glutamyl-tRNA(Gln) amidotransferase subunit A